MFSFRYTSGVTVFVNIKSLGCRIKVYERLYFDTGNRILAITRVAKILLDVSLELSTCGRPNRTVEKCRLIFFAKRDKIKVNITILTI